MKRRSFLGCAPAAAIGVPRLQSAPQPDNAAVRIKVQPDPRVHPRTFPRPPVTSRLDRLPHHWLTTFEDMENWSISTQGVQDPHAYRCTYRPVFRDSHVEVNWSSVEDGKITLVPPQPLKLPDAWNAVDFWIGGIPDDYRGPWMDCSLVLTDRQGNEAKIEICRKGAARRPCAVDMFHRLMPQTLCRKFQGGALKAIEVSVTTRPRERRGEPEAPTMLQLYALTVYQYRPRRTYRRPEKLPFPTHPDGVTPTPSVPGLTAAEQNAQGATRFTFTATDRSTVTWAYSPESGTLADLSVSVDGENAFQPCAGGGLVFEINGTSVIPPYSAALVSQQLENGRLRTTWELRDGGQALRYSLSFRMVNRSLIVEAQGEGASAVELRIGYPAHPGRARAIEIPMLTWDWNRWLPGPSFDYETPDLIQRKGGRTRSPAVLLAGDCFLTAILDWYASDASFVYAIAEGKAEPAGYDGGAYYLPVIDQGRNPLREKLILTASKQFQEVLPNIPNPPSPYTGLMRERVYSHGHSPSLSVSLHRNLGIHAVATLAQSYPAACDRGGYRPSNDTGCMDDWIDDPAQSRGGLARLVRKAEEFRGIGWLIGTYTNYCMMSPVFTCFAEHPIAHDSNGFPQSRWPGTMVPVTGETLPYLHRQSAKMKEVCGFQLIYDDQRTIVPIWRLNDYTPGTPGAGKFRETFEQGALLYMARAKQFGGPVLSEGGMHWMYAGLVDGNLSRVQHNPHDTKSPYLPPPDLVDFELRKLHLLNVDNCGNDYFDSWDPAVRDRFLCQTLAYGKAGLWNGYTGEGQQTLAMACRAYYTWHLAQKRYRCVPVQRILYYDGHDLVDASEIVRQGKERMGRIYVLYQNGLESWTNLNAKEPWIVHADGQEWRLPPFGWYQRRKEDWGAFVNYSVGGKSEGRRWRVEDSEALAVGGAGSLNQWEDLHTDGTAVLWRDRNARLRVVNVDASILKVRAERLGLAVTASRAAAGIYDLEGALIREATLPVERGWVDLSSLAQEQFALIAS